MKNIASANNLIVLFAWSVLCSKKYTIDELASFDVFSWKQLVLPGFEEIMGVA